MNIGDILKNTLKEENLYFNEPMHKHISFRVGGCADYFFLPTKNTDIHDAINICKELEIPFYLMGNGSNILIRDEGYRGMIIKIGKNMSNKYKKSNNKIYAESGILLSELSNFALENELSGMEALSGIPGTLGGAVFMNAGAYDAEIKDIHIKSTLYNPKTNQIQSFYNHEMNFDYRTSIVQKENLIILDTTLELEKGSKNEILDKMKDYTKRRKEKQPLEYPSAGSTFKRPLGNYAGKLIMDCGLRGASIGGAEVSEKHCGFVINKGNATAKDILELIDYIKETVYREFKIELEPEVRVL